MFNASPFSDICCGGVFLDKTQTRAFAGAFLRWQDEVILMRRSITKRISPGLWAGVGGHIEQSEANLPAAACLREIEEETGILSAQIEQLDLRYFALCRTSDAVDSIYYFAGLLKEKCILRETSEGELYWVKLNDAIEYPMAEHVKSFYLHWINNLSNDSFHCFVDSNIPLLSK